MRPAILLLCLVAAGSAGADPVEIPLTDLTGEYDSGWVPPNDSPRIRTSTFTIPAEVQSINDLLVVLSGVNLGDGKMICSYDIGGGQVFQDTLSAPTELRLNLTAPTLDGGCFWGLIVPLTPEFSDQSFAVMSCDHIDPLDPDLLLGTTVQAELECSFSPDCEPYLDSMASLTEVRLVIDAQLVADRRQTWDQIKALYR